MPTLVDVSAFAAINDLTLATGIFVGYFIAGGFKSLLNVVANRFERPRRVKAARDFGDFQYLYLWKGRYYSFGEYEEQRAKHLQKLKEKHGIQKIPFSLIIFTSLGLSTLFIYVIYSFDLLLWGLQ